MPTSPTSRTQTRDILGHPRGLPVLAGTELWERISFHGMLALLTLYMAEQLFLPGHAGAVVGLAPLRAAIESLTGPLSVEALAAQVFGLYAGLIYFTPVFGGIIGDRWLGRRRSVLLGALLMALGHGCMVFDQTFLLALVLLILGAGFMRGNLIAQVGSLYPAGDPRSANGIQIYYAMVNIGGFAAPLVTGLLARVYGWHVGFGFAGLGMVAGLLIYALGMHMIPADAPVDRTVERARLTARERRTVATLIALLPLFVLFFVGLTQQWNVYNLWARDHVSMAIGSWSMPVPWVQSMMAVESVILVPVVLRFWHWLERLRGPLDDLSKLAMGCIVFAAFTAMDGMGTLVFGTGGHVPLWWIVLSSTGTQFGYLNVQPVAIALYTRVAPKAINAMMVGIYFMGIFFGSLISGSLGGLYAQWTPTAFWLLHAGLVGAAGLVFAVLRAPVGRLLFSDRSV
ncbi:amino acid/peptide transporter [Novosphingobium nitrogenifigens DSM 19370]|uniref:Amino acid/peptide transporter n=1 Tax=Novosphingobium nitrogenifigens DSM 19370 TaxID=983920 RepID=F1Z3X5_9SPHN|nr:peptide MFS transporter [Novosphingobium nitrogenifigens]EGD60701.1 amino acid/peptide transporter [Novosphingobium nitrogenifigens DSM 19370]